MAKQTTTALTSIDEPPATPPSVDGQPPATPDPLAAAIEALLANGRQGLQPGDVDRITQTASTQPVPVAGGISRPWRDVFGEKLSGSSSLALATLGEALGDLAGAVAASRIPDTELPDAVLGLAPRIPGADPVALLPLWAPIAAAVARQAIAQRRAREAEAALQAEQAAERERAEAEAARQRANAVDRRWEEEKAARAERDRAEFFASRSADVSLVDARG